MNKIEVAVLGDYGNPGQMAGFLARLTQRGHSIKSMQDLLGLYNTDVSDKLKTSIAGLPHGTIKRFTPITIAIVGASRRFLAQARTNQVGFNYVSASLQYSDYSGAAQFTVPYEILTSVENIRYHNGDGTIGRATPLTVYAEGCTRDLQDYEELAKVVGNDAAGYKMPQGLRNILIMQGNHESWQYFIKRRSCSRNTNETAYVTMLIWDALLQTKDGQELFAYAGPDCMFNACQEGKFCCGSPMKKYRKTAAERGVTIPRAIINDKWPLIGGDVNA